MTEENIINFIERNNWIEAKSYSKTAPLDNVKWVDFNKVWANDYNPNSVAKIEMNLLFNSIEHDGYTQPVVTIYDKDNDKYIIVDGFHKWLER
jgi:hypothetical protein